MNETASTTGPDPRARRRTILLAIVGALCIAVAASLILSVQRAGKQRDDALRWQSHSYEVMIAARSLSNATDRAEAALGRYVISAETRDGVIFSDSWRLAGSQIDRLSRFIRDNPAQLRRLGEIRDAYRRRGDELARIAYHVQRREYREAYAFFGAARETEALVALEGALDRFIAAERTLLRDRTASAQTSVARSTSVTQVLLALGLVLAIAAAMLGWLMLRAWRESSMAQAEADAERARAGTLEAAVAAATADLRREASEREAAEAKLNQMQKMEAVGQLTGGIAHDFNNMLAVVIGGIELAKRRLSEGGAEADRHLDNAMEGAERAAALTRRLLAFARAEALDPQPLDPGDVIGGMRDLLDRTIGEAIDIETADESAGWRLCVDRHQLENAILNLAVNARDAMDGRGTITLTAHQTTLAAGEIGGCAAGDYVALSVADTGCGMTPEVRARVFEPFFTTKPPGKGTGLGLSQIFGFVRQSDGEIDLESEPGAGTRFTLYLPRYLEAGDTVPTPMRVGTAAPRDTDALDILLVEDDPRVLAATMGALVELGHRVTPCDDPLRVPAVLEGLDRVDLIVSDVLMPGQTGPEMIAALAGRIDDIGILYVTGFSGEETDAARFGGHPVLRKPFTMAALETAIADALSRRDARRRRVKRAAG